MPSPRAAKRHLELPTVEPIIPIERSTAFNDRDWLFEPKHDGFRGLVYLTSDSCTIRSRHGWLVTAGTGPGWRGARCEWPRVRWRYTGERVECTSNAH